MAMSQDEQELITAHYIGQGQPESFRMRCPMCRGGESAESTLAVNFVNYRLAYKCHRAKCGASGYVTTLSAPQNLGQRMKPKEFVGKSCNLDHHDVGQIMQQYAGFWGLARWPTREELAALGWLKVEGERTYLFELRSWSGRVLGKVTRTKDKKITTYLNGKGIYGYIPGQGQPEGSPEKDRPVILVEDYVSACAVALHGYDAIALMGTNFSEMLALEIRERKRRAFIYLDPDAFRKAIQLAVQYEMAVIPPGSFDPKDDPRLDDNLRRYVV